MKLSISELNIIKQANAIIDSKILEGQAIADPQEAKLILRPRIAYLEHEVFMVVFLNSQNKILAIENMFRGTIDGASVYPREVAKAALTYNAAAVILAHNHPSGVTTPSNADIMITRRLIDALGLLDIRVLDHIIFGAGPTASLADQGLII